MSRMRGSSLELRCTNKGRPRHSMGSDLWLCRYRRALANYREVLTADNSPILRNLRQESLVWHRSCAVALRVLFRRCSLLSSDRYLPTSRSAAPDDYQISS